MLGIRAYERREDLKAYNHRLMKYVNDGGTLIVQYNKTAEFNQAQYGPYPALVSSNRVTDETAPVQILEKEHHAFTYPNRIRQDAWDGWVQERGLYFLGEKDAKYTDLVQLQDPFEYNPGMKGGALVEATVRQGPVAVCRARSLASAAVRHGRRLPADGESDQPRQGPEGRAPPCTR